MFYIGDALVLGQGLLYGCSTQHQILPTTPWVLLKSWVFFDGKSELLDAKEYRWQLAKLFKPELRHFQMWFRTVAR